MAATLWRSELTLRGVPWTIVLFTITHLPTFVLPLLDGRISPFLVAAFVLLAVLFIALWRGSRAAWGFFLVTSVLGALSEPAARLPWWVFALNLISVALLLAPATRAFVRGRGSWPA